MQLYTWAPGFPGGGGHRPRVLHSRGVRVLLLKTHELHHAYSAWVRPHLSAPKKGRPRQPRLRGPALAARVSQGRPVQHAGRDDIERKPGWGVAALSRRF